LKIQNQTGINASQFILITIKELLQYMKEKQFKVIAIKDIENNLEKNNRKIGL
jgi:hypothetical protein